MILNQKGFAPLIIILAILALVGVGFLGYKTYGSPANLINSVNPAKNQPNKSSVKLVKINVAPRSKAPGLINAAITAHGFNPKTGAAVKPTKYFSPKDKQVYLLMNVNKPKVGSHIEYVRYLQGKYLDHRSIKISQANWKYAYFGWNAKPGKEHKKGVYRLRIYTNGVLEKKINYLVRS